MIRKQTKLIVRIILGIYRKVDYRDKEDAVYFGKKVKVFFLQRKNSNIRVSSYLFYHHKDESENIRFVCPKCPFTVNLFRRE